MRTFRGLCAVVMLVSLSSCESLVDNILDSALHPKEDTNPVVARYSGILQGESQGAIELTRRLSGYITGEIYFKELNQKISFAVVALPNGDFDYTNTSESLVIHAKEQNNVYVGTWTYKLKVGSFSTELK